MSDLSGGTLPPPGTSAGSSTWRAVIDQALLSMPRPGAIDTSASGGVVVNARLAAAIEEGLRNLYGATGAGLSEEEWLAVGLGVPVLQLASAGPAALSRLLAGAWQEPDPEFWPDLMTDEEDKLDAAEAAAAADQFAYPRPPKPS
jgi:hypothetical protein